MARKRSTPAATAARPPKSFSQAEDDRRRQAQRELSKAANLAVPIANNEADAEQRFLLNRAVDPFPDIPPALLNSADILDYVSATGMLYPFDRAKLKSASYEVNLLGPYVIHDETTGRRRRGILEPGESFTLPKNSIAFMTVEPFFRVPDYIALRHNLKIGHVYKGLLVGTGPLIDPGFVGKIALPLHNLTENDYEFEGGEGIIWVEFTKLSPRPEWSGGSGARTASYVTFAAEKTREKDVDAYIADAVDLLPAPASSSAMIGNRASEAVSVANEARNTTRIVSTIGVVALLSLGLAAIEQIVSLNYQIADLKVEVGRLAEEKLPPAPTDNDESNPSATPIPSPSATP